MKTYSHLMSSPSPSFYEINQLLIQFPPIESKLLTAINSYAFGLKNRIDTLSEALEKLGLISVNNIFTGLFADDSLDINRLTNIEMINIFFLNGSMTRGIQVYMIVFYQLDHIGTGSAKDVT